jgi:predicted HTH transcriptional regulator
LARTLAEAWPNDISRDTLIARAFRMKHADESHRARLRVEIGRLRKVLQPLADIQATQQGFMLMPHHAHKIVVLTPVIEDEHAAILALLSDSQAWSSSALALALGTSQRSVQRALDSLITANKVQAFGRGRARRWLTPSVPGFTTTLLLPATLPID